MKSLRRIIYGEASFPGLREKNGYYVDKTAFIPMLERYHSPVFLRPRRFGKSFWCSTLSTYYDINLKNRFQDYFGDTHIGRNPTSERNSCMCLHLDFSVVEVSNGDSEMEMSFNHICNLKLASLVKIYKAYFQDQVRVDMDKAAVFNLNSVLATIRENQLPPLFITIDEYDNFANQLILSRNDRLYGALTSEDGFFKTFFKALKSGKGEETIRRIFITGVLPITIDELASGYNIAQFLTLHPKFEAMLGFTQEEVDLLIEQVYKDYPIAQESRPQVERVVKDNYNGYNFLNGVSLYNSTILMFFLEKLCDLEQIPEFLTDPNLKTDIHWVKRLTGSNPQLTKDFVDSLTVQNSLPYNRTFLTEKFDVARFFEKEFFPISFFYLGMLTRRDDFVMCLPNMNMKTIFAEYFTQLHEVSVVGPYSEMMAGFLAKPDIVQLFADYWKHHVTSFPEAVFRNVNENFYRTTFYDICRQYLSKYYTWSMENSLASGRSDLEMMGQHGTTCAGHHFLFEFKYLSNSKTKSQGIDLNTFQARSEDLAQLQAYASERRASGPRIQAWLIYCFGNMGFKMFPCDPA